MNNIIKILVFGISLTVLAQNSDTTILKKPDLCLNSVSAELLGNNGLGSLNYERILLLNKNFGLSGTLGFSYIPKYSKKTITYQNYILGGTFLIRKEAIRKQIKSKRKNKNVNKVNYAEVGFFHVWQTPDQNNAQPWNNIYIGYNLYPVRSQSGFYCRIGFLFNIYRPGGKDRNLDFPISPIPMPRINFGLTF